MSSRMVLKLWPLQTTAETLTCFIQLRPWFQLSRSTVASSLPVNLRLVCAAGSSRCCSGTFRWGTMRKTPSRLRCVPVTTSVGSPSGNVMGLTFTKCFTRHNIFAHEGGVLHNGAAPQRPVDACLPIRFGLC
uniref:Putative secreted protein n=1 Tax=Amblyomma tuberculatum TaxID=48802 RepID=A0A6M2E2X1_9ACAR